MLRGSRGRVFTRRPPTQQSRCLCPGKRDSRGHVCTAINLVLVCDLREPPFSFATRRDAALHDCRPHSGEGLAGTFLISMTGCLEVNHEPEWGQVHYHQRKKGSPGAATARRKLRLSLVAGCLTVN